MICDLGNATQLHQWLMRSRPETNFETVATAQGMRSPTPKTRNVFVADLRDPLDVGAATGSDGQCDLTHMPFARLGYDGRRWRWPSPTSVRSSDELFG